MSLEFTPEELLRLPMIRLVNHLTKMCIQVALTGLNGLSKKLKRWQGFKWKEDLGGEGFGLDMIKIQCMHI